MHKSDDDDMGRALDVMKLLCLCWRVCYGLEAAALFIIPRFRLIWVLEGAGLYLEQREAGDCGSAIGSGFI